LIDVRKAQVTFSLLVNKKALRFKPEELGFMYLIILLWVYGLPVTVDTVLPATEYSLL